MPFDPTPVDQSAFAPMDAERFTPKGGRGRGARGWMGGLGAPTPDDPMTGSNTLRASGFERFFENAVKAALIAGGGYTIGGAAGLFGGGASGLSGATSGVATGLPGEMAALPALSGASVAAPIAGAATAATVPTVAGGTAAATAPSVAGGATAAHGLTASSVLKAAQGLAPVLGGAAQSQANSERQQDNFNLDAAQVNAALPGKRLAAAVRAGLLSSATPYKLNWGGPGSGLRGEIPTMSGGLDLSKLPPEVQQLAQQVIHDELMQELAGPVTSTGGTGIGDKVLGGGATAAGILGALLPLFTKSNASRTATPMPYTDDTWGA